MSWPPEHHAAGGPDRWLRELRRALLWRRRLLAAGLAAAAMAFALEALAPPTTGTVRVLVAARDLPGGARLGNGGARLVRRPADVVPVGALSRVDPSAVLAAPVRRGEVLTDVRLAGTAALRGLPDGLVAAPVRVADAQSAALLRSGDVVDVLAARSEGGDQARLVAAGVRVLSVSRGEDAGLVAAADGALLLLATSPPTAARLAAAEVTDRLSVVLRRR